MEEGGAGPGVRDGGGSGGDPEDDPPERKPSIKIEEPSTSSDARGRDTEQLKSLGSALKVEALDEEANQSGGAGPELSGRRRRRRRGRRRGRRRRRGLQRARRRQRLREARLWGWEQPRPQGERVQEGEGTLDHQDRDVEGTLDQEEQDEEGREGLISRELAMTEAALASGQPKVPRRKRSVDGTPLSSLTPGGPRPLPEPERVQPMPCFAAGCSWRGPQDHVVQHAREAHARLIIQGPEVSLAVPLPPAQDSESMRLLEALGELFVLQLRRRAAEQGGKRQLQVALRLLGPRSRTAFFTYLVQMQVSDEAAATRVSFLVSHPQPWQDPPDSAFRSLWSAQHFSKPLSSDSDQPRVLELKIAVQKTA